MFPLKELYRQKDMRRENVSLHLQTTLMSEFSSPKKHGNHTGFPTKRRLLLLSLNQNMWLHWRHRHTSFLRAHWLQTWWTLEFKPPWFSMPSSLLSLISEGQSSPHAFSSASPKQGACTRFNTSESLYTTDSQAAAAMYIPEQLLSERAVQGDLVNRRFTQFNVNLDTCLSYLRLRLSDDKSVDNMVHWNLERWSSSDLVWNRNFLLKVRANEHEKTHIEVMKHECNFWKSVTNQLILIGN